MTADQQVLFALIGSIAAGLLGLVLALLLLYLVLRLAITNGMKAYKRWERSGER